ncbi:MAG TPA: hypothetical protein VGR45_11375 [Stellaceae bacterium]|nr:hypothetical protein [Stellaceae bacterium]
MTDICNCCAPALPAPAGNRAGLSAIAYRIGTYGTFRQQMLDAIAGVPALASLTTRQSDDYSVTFIELWAALLDVLTFYQERYANEAFLRTALKPASLQRLARLLDYRPSPGVAASAKLAFTLDAGTSLQIPIGLKVQNVPTQTSPAQTYETLEAISADARFNRLRIYPEPVAANPLSAGNTQATLDRLTGPALLAAMSANDPVVIFNDTGTDLPEEKKIAGLTVQDDRVVLSWTTPVQGSDWTSSSVVFKYRRSFRLFGCNAPPSFMQPSTSAAVAGGIAWTQQSTDFTQPAGTVFTLDARYSDLATGTQLLFVIPPPPPPPPSPGGGWWFGGIEFEAAAGGSFHAAAASSALGKPAASIGNEYIGSLLGENLLQYVSGFGGSLLPPPPPPPGPQTFLATITQVAEVPASSPVQGQSGGQGAITDSVTQITVRPASVSTLGPINDIRSVSIFELVGGSIGFWPGGYDAAFDSSTVWLPGRLVQLGQSIGIEVGRTIQQNAFVPGVVIEPVDISVGREVILTDATGSAVEATVQATPTIEPVGAAAGSFAHLVLSLQATSVSLDAASAVLLGNVAQGGNGRTISGEVLGTGAAATPLQSFKLQNQPLTYVPSTAPGGVSSSLTVSVGPTAWSEVPELYGQAPSAQVFSTRTDVDGRTLVQFGGPQYGALLQTGATVSATYRIGTGIAGQVAAGALTNLLDRLPGLDGVTNPLPAEGGADPETAATIRDNAPRSVRTFDRAVSLLDFQDLITASGEVAKALAAWVWDGFAPAVHLTVAGQQGTNFADLTSLGATLANARDPNHRLLLDNFTQVPIFVAASLWTDPRQATADVIAAAAQAMATALSFDTLALGQSIHLSAIYAVLQGVSGVVAADVTGLGFRIPPGTADPNAYLDSRGVTRNPDGSVAAVQDFLRIFAARPNPSRPGSVLPAELAAIVTPAADISITAQG